MLCVDTRRDHPPSVACLDRFGESAQLNTGLENIEGGMTLARS
jgi:hypothetical protein